MHTRFVEGARCERGTCNGMDSMHARRRALAGGIRLQSTIFSPCSVILKVINYYITILTNLLTFLVIRASGGDVYAARADPPDDMRSELCGAHRHRTDYDVFACNLSAGAVRCLHSPGPNASACECRRTCRRAWGQYRPAGSGKVLRLAGCPRVSEERGAPRCFENHFVATTAHAYCTAAHCPTCYVLYGHARRVVGQGRR